jgi:hypothetical protein
VFSTTRTYNNDNILSLGRADDLTNCLCVKSGQGFQRSSCKRSLLFTIPRDCCKDVLYRATNDRVCGNIISGNNSRRIPRKNLGSNRLCFGRKFNVFSLSSRKAIQQKGKCRQVYFVVSRIRKEGSIRSLKQSEWNSLGSVGDDLRNSTFGRGFGQEIKNLCRAG